MAAQRPLEDGGASLAPVAHTVVPPAGVSALPFQEYLQPVNLSSQQTSPPAIQLQAREIDAYLIAHHQFSPSTAMHGLAPYARTVSPAAAETGHR
jgi:hypothetical protein